MRKLNELFSNRGLPWKYRTDYILEYIIKTQISSAKRNITPLHFWRFLKDQSGMESVYRDSNYMKRKYAESTSIYIAIKESSTNKALTRVAVEEEIDHDFKIDLGECIRLGEYFEEKDSKLPFYFYLPRSGDIYQWNNTLYEISDTAPETYYTPLERYIVWKGVSTQLHSDSVSPMTPLVPKEELIRIEYPLWIK